MKVWLPTVRAGSGSDVFIQRLAAGLSARGHEAIVEWLPHRYELMPWRLRSLRPPPATDIIQSNTWQGFAFKRPGIPLVVTEHHYLRHPGFLPLRGRAQALYHDVFVNRWVNKSLDACDALVAVSTTTANAIRAATGRAARVIHNWIDTDEFAPSAVRRRRDGSPFRLLFVGNPSRWKGSDLLPELALGLGPDFELRCLGGLRSGVASPVSNMLELPRVTPSDMPAVYRQVDAVAILARYESFGYVALEAMASGVPVLGFDNSGTAEICPRDAALLVPTNDLAALADGARMLAADDGLRFRMGQAGRAHAVRSFAASERVDDYIDVYARLAA